MKKKLITEASSRNGWFRKLFLIMRLTFVIILCCLLQVSASTYSQNTKLDVRLENASIKKLFKDIKKQSEFTFVYNVDDIEDLGSINCDFSESTVEEVLDFCLKGTKMTYEVREKVIVIVPRGKLEIVPEKPVEQPQKKTITGKVTDEKGLPLPGVSIVVKGTTTGITTDFDGNYTLEIPDDTEILVFSFVGMKTQEIAIGSKTIINVILVENIEGLEEVVVTALGIKRTEKSLGYSVTQVKGASVKESNENNIIDALAGKVAGVQINSVASGADGSSSIIIRGQSSLGGNNQPLFVIDGIQLDNNSTNINNVGIDYGNGISDLNADDIESMSVLKGPSAAALYGSRAANGVIIITTKKGKVAGGAVQVSSTVTFDRPYDILSLQNEFGSGQGPRFSDGFFQTRTVDGVDYPRLTVAWNNFGAKMDGTTVVGFNGELRPYSPQPNNIHDLYQNSISFTNNIAFSGSNKDGSSTYRISLTSKNNEGIIPTNTSDRYTINFRGTHKITSKLSSDVSMSYIKSKGKNRPEIGNTRLLYRYAGFFPRDMPYETFEAYYKNTNGSRNRANPWNYTRHHWNLYENSNLDESNRFIGGFDLNYQFNDWLRLKGSANTDTQTRYWEKETGGELAQGVGGKYEANMSNKAQYTCSFLLSFDKDVSENISVSASLGGSQWSSKVRGLGAKTDGDLIAPNFFSISNSSKVAPGSSSLSKRQINSLYGFGQIAYKNYLFLDVTGRNDWSSTLPIENNSYFYPSVSSGFVFSEAFDLEDQILSFGKIRASWAKVGNDAQQAYLLAGTYGSTEPYKTYATAVAPTLVPPGNLLPEETSSVELGFDLRFLNNRLGVDFNWYQNKTKNQILKTPIPTSSGGNLALINAGEIENKGLEFLLNASPVKTKNFNWDVSFNFSQNKNKVIELANGVDNLLLASNGSVTVEARPGSPYGDIVTLVPETDPETGKLIIGANGRIFRDFERKVVGNIQPDWTGGVFNEFSYKGFKLAALIDISMGGELYSYTERWITTRGASTESLFGRDAEHGGLEWTDSKGRLRNDGMIVEGVLRDGTPNNIIVEPTEYYNQSYGFNWPKHVVDASYVMLKEVSLSYKLPSKILDGLKIRNASVSLVGRNPWIIFNGTKRLDPTSTAYGTGNGSKGLEASGVAPVRSYAINIKFTL